METWTCPDCLTLVPANGKCHGLSMTEEADDNYQDGPGLGLLLLAVLVIWVWGAIVGAGLMWIFKS